MAQRPFTVQINDSPGSELKNDLCLHSLNVEEGRTRVSNRLFENTLTLEMKPC